MRAALRVAKPAQPKAARESLPRYQEIKRPEESCRPGKHQPGSEPGGACGVAPPAATEPQLLSSPEEVRVECLAEAKAPPRYQEMKRPES